MAARLLGSLALVGGAGAQLVSNDVGKGQELCTANLRELCGKRTHINQQPSVLLDVPDGCDGPHSKCPIAFFLHGQGSKGKHSGKMFLDGPDAASKLLHGYHFIGVYPTSDFGWNTDGDTTVDKCTPREYNCTTDNNDVAFMSGIAAFLKGQGSTGRIYAYGSSDGSALAQKLAANSGPDGGTTPGLVVSGIWASGGQLLAKPVRSGPGGFYNQPSQVAPRNTLPVAQASSHGDEDAEVPYAGGKSALHKRCPECVFLSEEASNKMWAEHNGCKMAAGTETFYYKATFGTATNHTVGQAERNTYQCPENAAVEYWKIIGAPHGGAESFSVDYHSKNQSKIAYVVQFFSRVEEAQKPPPAPKKPGAINRIIDDVAKDLPYGRVTLVAAIACCVCMCMAAICGKGGR